MDKFPYEINYKILGYTYGCRKDNNYVYNKESNNIFKEITKNCEKINIFNKNLCQNCDKKNIWHVRMIMNNLLPG